MALSKWVKAAGFSQETVAGLVGDRIKATVSQGQVSRWINGAAVPNGLVQSALWTLAKVRVEWWSEPAPREAAPSSSGPPTHEISLEVGSGVDAA